MATVYKISIEVLSEYINYTDAEICEIAQGFTKEPKDLKIEVTALTVTSNR